MGIFRKNQTTVRGELEPLNEGENPCAANEPVFGSAARLSMVDGENVGFDPYDTASLYIQKATPQK